MSQIDGITFYPRIPFLGREVSPRHWHAESEEPLLNVMMEVAEALPGDTAETQRARKDKLAALGWEIAEHDGLAAGYVHVDDLEKIEGPPPKGPF